LVVREDADGGGLTQIEKEINIHPRSSMSHALLRGDEAIQETRRLLAQGKIVAVKGLGGFHLACDATNDAAVAELRRRKGRADKPFALMAADVATVERFCEVMLEERALLESRQRPIVLLARRSNLPTDGRISDHVAPRQATLGVMLPYAPLHYLLFDDSLHPLVMTSGNLSEEPIATGNDEAVERLSGLANAFLLHNRDIHVRCDDSVVRVFESCELPIRRSRGYAPYPVKLPSPLVTRAPVAAPVPAPMAAPMAGKSGSPSVLATGAELKNTFCVTRGGYAFLSHHIGDMENYETLRSFEDGIAHFERLFRIQPERIAYDLHPNYLATRYAIERAGRDGLRAVGVQHHHAHIAACMVENGLSGDQPVIGVAFDGAGYGSDGAVWGGEFLIADYRGFERAAHLAYVPLPGGDAATRNPYRMALSYLHQAGVEWADDLAPVAAASLTERLAIARQIESGLNAPPSSSMGRLFDAVASIAGVRQSVNYEGQAAIEMEAMANRIDTGQYHFEFGRPSENPPLRHHPAGRRGASDTKKGIEGEARRAYVVNATAVIRAVVGDIRAGAPASTISARFHNGLAAMIGDMCVRIRDERGLNEVALSGGVFQNMTLLKLALDLLHAAGFTIYTHRIVPPNDGGLALGQAVVAMADPGA
jgi:hydrogenase maturation protein HypF